MVVLLSQETYTSRILPLISVLSLELVRAVSYKRSMDIKNKELTEAGFDAAKEKLFTGLASDDPELYRQLADYIESKKSELIV